MCQILLSGLMLIASLTRVWYRIPMAQPLRSYLASRAIQCYSVTNAGEDSEGQGPSRTAGTEGVFAPSTILYRVKILPCSLEWPGSSVYFHHRLAVLGTGIFRFWRTRRIGKARKFDIQCAERVRTERVNYTSCSCCQHLRAF